jgi:hypothetical protein
MLLWLQHRYERALAPRSVQHRPASGRGHPVAADIDSD